MKCLQTIFCTSLRDVLKKKFMRVNLENLLPIDRFNTEYNALGGGTPLHWAIRIEDVEAVTYILEACKEDVNAKDDWWRATALHWVVRTGNMAIMNAMCTHHLESKKFDLGVLDRWGFTALECAIFKSDVPMVQVLLRFGNGHSDPIGVIKEVSDELRKGGSMEVCQQYFESQRQRWYESILSERGGRRGSVLHWTLLMEDTSLANQIFTKGEVNVNATDSSYYTPLHLAVLTRNLDMVKMMVADSKVDVNAHSRYYLLEVTTPLQMAVLLGELDMVKIMVDKHLELGNFDVNYAEWKTGHTVLYCAIVNGEEENVDIVRELLRCKDTMRLTEECETGETPLQIAHERGFKDIEKSLLECAGVQRYMDQLYRDRQVYVDAANAILVGAALIASVTFASWLQPPLGYGTLGLVDVQHNQALRAFWIFNCLSFYFAIGTVVFGARSVLPRSPYFIKVTVEKLQTNLLVTASLLACSVFFVIIAFGIAGCLVLSPMLEFQLYMIVPAIVGGLVCIISLVFLSKSMWEGSSLGKSTALVKGKEWKKALTESNKLKMASASGEEAQH